MNHPQALHKANSQPRIQRRQDPATQSPAVPAPVPPSSQVIPGAVPETSQLAPGGAPSTSQLAPGIVPPSTSQLAPGILPPSTSQLAQGGVPSTSQLAPGAVPSTSQLVPGVVVPSTSQLAPGVVIPSTSQLAPGAVPSTSQLAPGAVPPSTSQLAPGIVPPSTSQLAPGAVPSTSQLAPGIVMPSTSQLAPGIVPPSTSQLAPGVVPSTSQLAPGAVPSTSQLAPGIVIPSTSQLAPGVVPPSTSQLAPGAVPSTSQLVPGIVVPSTSQLAPGVVPSTSQLAPGVVPSTSQLAPGIVVPSTTQLAPGIVVPSTGLPPGVVPSLSGTSSVGQPAVSSINGGNRNPASPPAVDFTLNTLPPLVPKTSALPIPPPVDFNREPTSESRNINLGGPSASRDVNPEGPSASRNTAIGPGIATNDRNGPLPPLNTGNIAPPTSQVLPARPVPTPDFSATDRNRGDGDDSSSGRDRPSGVGAGSPAGGDRPSQSGGVLAGPSGGILGGSSSNVARPNPSPSLPPRPPAITPSVGRGEAVEFEETPKVTASQAAVPPVFPVGNSQSPRPSIVTPTLDKLKTVIPSETSPTQAPLPAPAAKADDRESEENREDNEEEDPEPTTSTKSANQYDWVPSSKLLQNPSAAPKAESSEAESDPKNDDPQVTPLPVVPKADEKPKEDSSSTSSAKAALPSEWPSSIVPQRSEGDGEENETGQTPVGLADAKNAPRSADTSLVSILLTKALSWSWLLAQSDASAQVFAYMPSLIAKSLRIDESLVTTISLEAWEPPGWTGDGAEVRSVWVGHMPTKKVDYLASLIVNTSSVFYTEGKPIVKQLSSCVDASLPLLSLQNSLGLEPEASGDAGGGEKEEEKMSNKQTAFVASAAALGAIVLAVGAFFGSKYAMKRRARSNRGDQDNSSLYSNDNSSFTSRSRGAPEYESPAAPFDQYDDRPRDSDYHGTHSDYRGTQSEYPITERDSMRDTYGRASAAPTIPLPEPPEAYRDSYDSYSGAPLARTNGQSSYYPTERSFINTARSGSGSSVQSDMLGGTRRQSSVDIPMRDTWWKHASQWNQPAEPAGDARGVSVMSDPVPKSGRVITFDRPFSASTLSSLQTAQGSGGFGGMGPFGNQHPFGNAPNNKPAKISAPYLQDNSLML